MSDKMNSIDLNILFGVGTTIMVVAATAAEAAA